MPYSPPCQFVKHWYRDERAERNPGSGNAANPGLSRLHYSFQRDRLRSLPLGRKTERPRIKWLDVALMLFPYATPETWELYVVGGVLSAALYWI